MVCLGNICRSPMAEGVLRSKLEEVGLDIIVDSAGTSNYHIGESPDRRAIKAMAEKGIDISKLKARQFSKKDFDDFDNIYVMDQSNFADVMDLCASDDHRAKVKMLLNELYPAQNLPVPDPWFGGMEGFYQVHDLLDRSCEVIVQKILKSR